MRMGVVSTCSFCVFDRVCHHFNTVFSFSYLYYKARCMVIRFTKPICWWKITWIKKNERGLTSKYIFFELMSFLQLDSHNFSKISFTTNDVWWPTTKFRNAPMIDDGSYHWNSSHRTAKAKIISKTTHINLFQFMNIYCQQ